MRTHYDFSKGEIGKYAHPSIPRSFTKQDTSFDFPTENELDSFLGRREKVREKPNNPNQYNFVSKSEDVDYLRIMDETPKGTPFIVVEERTRSNRPVNWTLLIAKEVLRNSILQGRRVLGKRLNPNWGNKSPEGYEYRYIVGKGKFPGMVKQQLIKLLLTSKREKDTRTRVTYIGNRG